MPRKPAQHLGNRPTQVVKPGLSGELPRFGKETGADRPDLAEQEPAGAVKARLGQRWMEQNVGAIEAYNRRVEARGVFSDGLRAF